MSLVFIVGVHGGSRTRRSRRILRYCIGRISAGLAASLPQQGSRSKFFRADSVRVYRVTPMSGESHDGWYGGMGKCLACRQSRRTSATCDTRTRRITMKSIKRVLAFLGCGMCLLAAGCPLTDVFSGVLGG